MSSVRTSGMQAVSCRVDAFRRTHTKFHSPHGPVCCHDHSYVVPMDTGGISNSAGHKGLTTGPGSSTTSTDSHLPEKAATAGGQRDSSLVSGSTGGIGKDSAVKESTSAGHGTGLVSKDSPKAVSGWCFTIQRAHLPRCCRCIPVHLCKACSAGMLA